MRLAWRYGGCDGQPEPALVGIVEEEYGNNFWNAYNVLKIQGYQAHSAIRNRKLIRTAAIPPKGRAISLNRANTERLREHNFDTLIMMGNKEH